MVRLTTPEQHQGSRLVLPTVTRRTMTLMGLGGLAPLLLPGRTLAQDEVEGDVPKNGGADPASETEYTGPLHGHIVTWEPEFWTYSSSATPDLDYDYDYISLSSVKTFALSQVQHSAQPLDGIDAAEDGSFDLYLAGYGMSRSDAELLDQWASDDAAGTLFYWLGYDDIPYTYIEYARTDDNDVWGVSYIQIRASEWDGDAMTDMMESIWTDDELNFRATDVADVVDAIDADAG